MQCTCPRHQTETENYILRFARFQDKNPGANTARMTLTRGALLRMFRSFPIRSPRARRVYGGECCNARCRVHVLQAHPTRRENLAALVAAFKPYKGMLERVWLVRLRADVNHALQSTS